MKIDLKQIKTLRLKSEFEKVIGILGAEKNIAAQPPPFFEELIMVLILQKEISKAMRLYELFGSLFKENASIRSSIYERLKSFSADLPKRKTTHTPRWVDEKNKNGVETIFNVEILSLKYYTSSHSIFRFGLKCGGCHTQFRSDLTGSFLVHKEMYCPNCLAAVLLKYDSILKYIKENYSDYLGAAVYQHTFYFNKLRKDLNNAVDDEKIPLLAGYMNQDTIFTLNELLLSGIE
jgi:hypothetical protein